MEATRLNLALEGIQLGWTEMGHDGFRILAGLSSTGRFYIEASKMHHLLRRKVEEASVGHATLSRDLGKDRTELREPHSKYHDTCAVWLLGICITHRHCTWRYNNCASILDDKWIVDAKLGTDEFLLLPGL